MSDIFIWPKSIVATTGDGAEMEIYPLFFIHNNQFCELHEIEPALAREISGFRIMRRFLPYFRTSLEIPSSVVVGIRDQLPCYLGEHDKDCYDFVNEVFGVPLHGKEDGHWIWHTRGPASVRKPGDVIFLLDIKNQRFIHAAIYIGNDFCFSVNGKHGAVGVAKLEDMARDYEAVDVRVMKLNITKEGS